MLTLNRRVLQLPPIVAVTSGKGGVGKSVIAFGCARLAAHAGVKTLLIDGDLGLGNLHILANTTPVFTFEDLLAGNCRLEDAVIDLGNGLALLPARSGLPEAELNFSLAGEQLQQNLTGLSSRYNLLVIDTPSGIGWKTTDLVSLADQILLVVTPDLAALADGYAVLKTIHGQAPKTPYRLLVNLVQSAAEGRETAEKFAQMTQQFLGLAPLRRDWLGLDETLRTIQMRQRLLSEAVTTCAFLEQLQPSVMHLLSQLVPGASAGFAAVASVRAAEYALSSIGSVADKKPMALPERQVAAVTDNSMNSGIRENSL